MLNHPVLPSIRSKVTNCISLCLLFFAPAFAIAQTAHLGGTITDPQGNVIPGAAVSAVNEETGIRRTTESREAGAYDIPALAPGRYTLRIEQPGFAVLQRTGVLLQVDTTTRVDLQLRVVSASSTVNVTDQPSLLQPNTPEAETSIESKEFNQLPLVQQGRIRSPAAFVYLAPSVQGNIRLSGTENTSATNEIQVNGSQTQVTEILVEGLSAGKQRTPGSFNESAPPVDAVREFKITTTLLPADFGHTGAAVGSFSIKSGTNGLHGSIYEYFRNSGLDAHSHGALIKPTTHQNEFGATLGGPIVLPHLYDGRNRSFFFFSYGGSRKIGSDSLQQLTVPSVAMLSGDFSGGPVIYDPSTTRLDPTGARYIRDPFPGNKIPASSIDRVGRAIAAYYPQVQNRGANNYQAFAGEKLLNPDIFTFKIDHQISSAHRVSATLVATNIPRFRIDTALPTPLTAGIRQTAIAKTARVNYDWILGANKLNSIAVGYNRFVDSQQPPSEFDDQLSKIGLGGISGGVFPTMSFSNGYASAGTNTAQRAIEDSFLLKDTFSWTLASHELRLGAEFRRTQLNDIVPGFTEGSLSFSNKETGDPNQLNTTGDAFASLLLGQADTGGIQVPLEIATRRGYAGAFIQDDWKASSHLTLNGGVRWEMQTVPNETANRSSAINLSTPNPSAGNLPGALIFAGSGTGRSGQRSFQSNDFSAFSGRFGLAYQPLTSTVIRAGYGLYYSDFELGIVSTGFQPQASFTTTNNGITPAFTLANGYPQSGSLQPTLSPSLINGQSGTYFQSNAGALPRTQEWSLSLQQALGSSWLVELDYVGDHATRQVNGQLVNVNQVNPSYLALGSLLTQQANSAAAQAAGIRLPYPTFSGTVAQALRPFPQYQALTAQSAKVGASEYNAMQALLKRRFASGLTLNLNYTYSKNLGYASPSFEGFDSVDNTLQNAYNPAAEWTVLPNDVRHALVINYSYDLPFGLGQSHLNSNRLENVVFGGWTFTGVHRYQSGFPLPILMTNSLPIFNRILRPNKVPGVDPATHISAGDYRPGISRRINPAAFALPAAYSFGSASPTYGDLTSFPVYSDDLAAVKQFRVNDHLRWNWYAQFFNVFNRHRYTLIDGNFSDAGFGQSSGVSQPRLIQIGTRLEF